MKPSLLFLTPFVPTPAGLGSSIRAYHTLCALAERYDVHCLVAARPQPLVLPEHICRKYSLLPLGLWPDPHARLKRILAAAPALSRRLWRVPAEWRRASGAPLGQALQGRSYDVLHVFRAYLAPIAERLAGVCPCRQRWLDSDDVESATRFALADLHARRGELLRASALRLEAERYARIEATELRRFHRLFLAAPEDCETIRLRGVHPSPEHLPNVVGLPSDPPGSPEGAVFRFLFVGTLGYLPNADAAEWIALEVVPRLRACAPGPFEIRVAGPGLGPRLRRVLSRAPEVVAEGWVHDLASAYRDASAVLVPLRAGGGTSLKILEAFAQARPVVSTPQGTRGLGAQAGREFLLAESASAFAEACARLMRDRALARSLARAGRAWVEARHAPSVLKGTLMAGSGEGP